MILTNFNQQTMENTKIRLKNLAWLGRSLTRLSLKMYDFPAKIMSFLLPCLRNVISSKFHG